MEKSFLDIHKSSLEISGFWEEEHKSLLIRHIERMYKTDILREWGISDIIINGDKVLLKWYKR